MAPAPEGPTPAWAALAHAQITQAPSADAFLLRRSGVQSCAASCIDSAVSEGTQCSVSDYACECQSLNALIIQASAYGCVLNACGVAVGVGVWSEAADYCSSVRAGKVTLTGVSSTAKTTETSDGPVVTVTETAANGQVTLKTIPTFVSSPTGSGGSGSTASGGTTNTSQGSSLSTGAIVGIAIGAAAGAILLCAIAFLFYKRRGKQNATPPAETANSATGPSPAPASAAAGLVPNHKPELDGKPGLAVVQHPQPDHATQPAVLPSPSPVSHSTTLISHHPSLASNPNVSPASHHQHDPNKPQIYGYTPPQGVEELHAQQTWHMQQPTPPPGYQVAQQGQGQPAHMQHLDNNAVPSHYEMGVMPPELQPNAAQFVPELPGGGGRQQQQGGYTYDPSQGYGRAGAYEMPGSHG